MKVVLVYPRWQWFEYNGLAEPLGLLQIAASLRKSGHRVEYADYTFCNSLDDLDHMYEGAGLCGVAVSAAAVTGIPTRVTSEDRAGTGPPCRIVKPIQLLIPTSRHLCFRVERGSRRKIGYPPRGRWRIDKIPLAAE